MLTEIELERLAQLKDAARRADLESSFRLRRSMIAELVECRADEVGITADGSGAPLLAAPVRHSLTLATKGRWTLLAIDEDSVRIGSDIEIIRPIDWRAMLRMACSVEEASVFAAQHDEGEGALADFFRLWTIKEAILKATGQGFRAGPKNIHVPDAFYSGTAHGVILSMGARFEVWAIERDGLALSLSRKTG